MSIGHFIVHWAFYCPLNISLSIEHFIAHWTFHCPFDISLSIEHFIAHWTFHCSLDISLSIGHFIVHWTFHCPLSMAWSLCPLALLLSIGLFQSNGPVGYFREAARRKSSFFNGRAIKTLTPLSSSFITVGKKFFFP